MERTKLNFFQRLLYSITDFSFYQNVVKEKTGKAIGYIVLLSLLISLITMLEPTIGFLDAMDTLSAVFESDVPNFQFSDGQLTVDSTEPIVMDLDGSEILILDTSGQYDETILNDFESGVLITRTYAISKKNVVQTERIDFSQLKPLAFSKDQVLSFLPYLKYFSIAIVLWILIGTIVGKLLGSLIVSLLALIINAIMKTSFSYDEVYRLGIYAMTLPSLIKVAVSFLPITIPFFFVVYYVIVGIYLAKAFSLIQQEKMSLAYKDPHQPY